MTSSKLEKLVRRPRADAAETNRLTPVRPHGIGVKLAPLVPAFLIIGFVLLAWMLLGDRLTPARELELATVVTVRNSSQVPADKVEGPAFDVSDAPMLFQASGWVEPDPLPIKATALVSGVVDQVEVLEGASVAKGQLLATLIDEDARLNLRSAESQLRSLEAQAAAHRGDIAIAEAELKTLEKQVIAGRGRCAELQDVVDRYEGLSAGSVSEREKVEASLKLATHNAEVEAIEAQKAEIRGKILRLTELTGNFEARIAEAKTEVDRKQLDLDRTKICSPVDGVILRLLAVPGQKRMLEMDDPDSATIAVLYQPGHLQARIDVPLEEASQLAVNQAVRIRSGFLQDRIFHGTVTRIVGEADLQRNTLQAKVRIDDPDPRLRPEMLCRAEFLSAATTVTGNTGAGGSGAAAGQVILFAPETALVDAGENRAEVWVVESGRVEKRPVTLGRDRREDHVEIRKGLNPGALVVVHPPRDLEPGDKVRERK